MKLTEIPAPDFDLAMTLDSGQVFHWERVDGGFIGTIGQRTIYVEQADEILRVGRGQEELRECALGYRAGNLLATARLVGSGAADLEAWSALPDADLREKLCALPGVGAKVANCVMLFAYERRRAFPIDVWIERVLRQQYFPRNKTISPEQLRTFSETYFGEHGGYAQQYLFHHARMIKNAKARAPRAAAAKK